jgi:CRP-like cAMP-binding protein
MRNPTVTHRLSDAALFATCDRKERQRVDRIGTQVRRPAGAVLAHEGAMAREFLVVLDGSVTACHGDAIDEFSAGCAIGAREIIQGTPHTATMTAATPVVLEVLTLREFATLLEIVPTIAYGWALHASARGSVHDRARDAAGSRQGPTESRELATAGAHSCGLRTPGRGWTPEARNDDHERRVVNGETAGRTPHRS